MDLPGGYPIPPPIITKFIDGALRETSLSLGASKSLYEMGQLPDALR